MSSAQEAQFACKLALFSLTAAFLFISPPSIAQEAEDPGLWAKTKADLANIVEEGRWDLYLSGYAYHGRDTDTKKRLHKLNEKAWGAGVGKTVRNENGNDESLYVMAIRDSNMHPQWMAGYSYQWIHPISSGSKLEVGAGITALIMRRSDWFGGVPFPAGKLQASCRLNAAFMLPFLVLGFAPFDRLFRRQVFPDSGAQS